MEKRSRGTHAIALCAALAVGAPLALGACGGGDGPSGPGPSNDPPPVQPPPPGPDFDFSGDLVAFRRTTTARQDIWLITADGSQSINLTDHPAADSDPAWSPDGSRLAFVSQRSGRSELWVMELEDGSLTQVTNDPGTVRFPTWSPDGSMIAFSTRRDGQRDIFAVPAPGANPALFGDGTTECRLTNHSATDNEPVWVQTPDGEWIFFYSSREAEPGVFRIGIECGGGATAVKITKEFEWACSPGSGWTLVERQLQNALRISANDLRISTVALADDQYDVYTMDLDGSNPVNVSNHSATDFNSSFAGAIGGIPCLVFDSRRSGREQIWHVCEDGSNLKRLTNNASDDEMPAFRPAVNGASSSRVLALGGPLPGAVDVGGSESGAAGAPFERSTAFSAPVVLYDRQGEAAFGRSCAASAS